MFVFLLCHLAEAGSQQLRVLQAKPEKRAEPGRRKLDVYMHKQKKKWALKKLEHDQDQVSVNAVIVKEEDRSTFACGGSPGNPFSHQYGNPYNIFLLSPCHVTLHIKVHQRQ